MMQKFKQAIKGKLLVTGWRLVAKLPLTWQQALARGLAGIAWRFAKRERNISQVNLRLCFPHLSPAEVDALALESFKQQASTLVEMGYVWSAKVDKVLASLLAVEGVEAVFAAQDKQQPVIILAPHLGQWELIAFWLSYQRNFTFMYSPPDNPAIDELMREGRCRTGGQLVPANLKGVAGLLKVLRQGGMVGILPDQVPSRGQGGVVAPFYGQPALTATLLPKLVEKTQAQVFTCVALREAQGFKLVFQPADERVYNTDELTAATGVNASVEAVISLATNQYQWAYKRFRNTGQVDVYKHPRP